MQNPLPLLALLGAAAALGGVVLGGLDARGHFADADDTALVARGAALYAANCAGCHGAHLQGAPNWQVAGPDRAVRPPPQDATGHTWMHSDDQLFQFVKYSLADIAPPGFVSNMPAFENQLSDRDIVATIAFIKSSWPTGVRVFQAMLNPHYEGIPAAALHDGNWYLPTNCGNEPIRLLSDTGAGQPAN